MGWTLPDLRDLEVEEFNALCDWAQRRSEARDEDSVDVDALMEARRTAHGDE